LLSLLQLLRLLWRLCLLLRSRHLFLRLGPRLLLLLLLLLQPLLLGGLLLLLLRGTTGPDGVQQHRLIKHKLHAALVAGWATTLDRCVLCQCLLAHSFSIAPWQQLVFTVSVCVFLLNAFRHNVPHKPPVPWAFML
jgi:hypothetical protein